jgi:hypothetical protein
MGVKVTKDNLVLAFNDDDGNGYYKFPSNLEMPLSRLAKVKEYIMWLSRGVSKEEYLKAINAAKQGLEGGIKDGKGLAKIAFVLQELENRCEMVIHDELFYNIIACQLVRQDESTTEFNNEIQMQKVEAFRDLDKKNDTFFLHIQEFLALFNLSNITKTKYDTLMKGSQLSRQAKEKMLISISKKQ